MAALDSFDGPGAPRVREIRTDWAKVGGWAAATGLCLAVWTAVFLVFYFGWTV